VTFRVCFSLFAAISGGCSSTTQPLGERTFQTHCAACHGPLAEGDGPTAATLAVPVPNLRTLSERNGGTFPTDAVASYIDGRSSRAAHGTREMPAESIVDFMGLSTSQLAPSHSGGSSAL
jgi:mono/diheme cytochrome c family protein